MINVYFFEVFTDKVYTYQGQVILTDKPFQEVQDDEDEYAYYDDSCASHITEVFVASSIPVLHFIQYFMC